MLLSLLLNGSWQLAELWELDFKDKTFALMVNLIEGFCARSKQLSKSFGVFLGCLEIFKASGFILERRWFSQETPWLFLAPLVFINRQSPEHHPLPRFGIWWLQSQDVKLPCEKSAVPSKTRVLVLATEIISHVNDSQLVRKKKSSEPLFLERFGFGEFPLRNLLNVIQSKTTNFKCQNQFLRFDFCLTRDRSTKEIFLVEKRLLNAASLNSSDDCLLTIRLISFLIWKVPSFVYTSKTFLSIKQESLARKLQTPDQGSWQLLLGFICRND